MDKFLLLDYPYYNLYYKFSKKDFLKEVKDYIPKIYEEIPKNISKYNHIEKYNKKYFIIKETYNDTKNINNITDYFSEKVRINCRFGNYISPQDYWNKNKRYIIEKSIKKYKILNVYNIREIIYENTKLCNNFRITVALTILNYFKPKKWLDISAGWGDRLISALLYKIKLYVSCDPNLDLHPCYNEMINTFATPSKKNNFIIYKNGFLEAPLPNEKFDIVFSSPPFFTLEKYSSYNENSLTKISTEKEWCDKFFIPSLMKAYKYLKKDGHIILYMGGSPYVMEKMHFLDKIMEYKGIIYFYEKKPRGMFVWKKTNI
jgi:16S rRNA G966 N2-methylase RsmD